MTITSSGPVCDVCGEYILLEAPYFFKVEGTEKMLHADETCNTLLHDIGKDWKKLPDGPLRRAFEKHAKEHRIAVHILGSICLPLQKGEPQSPERIASNAEIEQVLQDSEYSWEDIQHAGYFIPEEWHEIDDEYLRFKNSEGSWIKTKKDWAIFESEHPEFLKGLDSQLDDKEITICDSFLSDGTCEALDRPCTSPGAIVQHGLVCEKADKELR